MFPPKKIGIIGNLGKMATNVVTPFFKERGYEVIGSDIKSQTGLSNRDVVERADVVYFSILPIVTVAPVMLELTPYAQPDTLWLHGTSIQNPVRAPIAPVLLAQELILRKVDVGYLHFMVGPMVRSLRGQSIVYGLPRDLINPSWEDWLIDLLKPTGAFLLKYSPESHDELTTGSQIIPQLVSLLVSHLWRKRGFSLSDVLQMAGPPCWLQAYGILRNLSQPAIVGNIVTNHPNTREVIEQAIETLKIIQKVCEEGREEQLSEMAEKGSAVVSEDELNRIRDVISWHVRLEGDLRGQAVCFTFPPEKNKVGLLTQVLQIFDNQGLDKTSCTGQEVPGGGCIFYVGVKVGVDDPRVRAACREVIQKLGGKVEISS